MSLLPDIMIDDIDFDGNICLWSLSAGQLLRTIHRPYIGAICALIWVPLTDSSQKDVPGFILGGETGWLEAYHYDPKTEQVSPFFFLQCTNRHSVRFRQNRPR